MSWFSKFKLWFGKFQRLFSKSQLGQPKTVSPVMGIILILLLIELLDELVDGVRGAAWPLIRQDLQLSYAQVGMVLTIPNAIASVIEPFLGIWADIGDRRRLILSGGVGFAIALLIIALSQDFTWFLLGFILFYPASGSFVSLAQATLMDVDPDRHEHNMARWVLAGSLGNVIGPLILTGAIAVQQSWRGGFFILAVLTGLSLAFLWQSPIVSPKEPSREAFSEVSRESHAEQPPLSFQQGIANAIGALKRWSIVRWLTLLQFSDLMLDVLRGFLALYFVDVVGATTAQSSLAIAIWLGVGLLGDFLLIPLLERVSGTTYLKISASLVLCLYPAFLLVPSLTGKFILLGGLGFLNAGWYSILQGRLYTAMPGQSGTVMAVSNVFGFVGGLAPVALGLMAQQFGLDRAMWVILVAPIALLIGLI